MSTRFEHISGLRFDRDGYLTRESYDKVEALAYPIAEGDGNAFVTEIADAFEEGHRRGEPLNYEHHNGGWEPDLVITADEL